MAPPTVLKRVSGHSWTYGGEEHSGWLPAGAARPPRTPIVTVTLDLEIVADGSGFLVVYRAREDESLTGDWWLATAEDAQVWAEERFGVRPDRWIAGS